MTSKFKWEIIHTINAPKIKSKLYNFFNKKEADRKVWKIKKLFIYTEKRKHWNIVERKKNTNRYIEPTCFSLPIEFTISSESISSCLVLRFSHGYSINYYTCMADLFCICTCFSSTLSSLSSYKTLKLSSFKLVSSSTSLHFFSLILFFWFSLPYLLSNRYFIISKLKKKTENKQKSIYSTSVGICLKRFSIKSHWNETSAPSHPAESSITSSFILLLI